MSVAGRCHLRASPAVGVGGMYATARGPEKPIGTAALIPQLLHEQVWTLLPVDGQEEAYGIFWDKDGLEPSSFGWAYSGERLTPDEPLVVSNDTHKYITWRVQKHHVHGVDHAYTFIANHGLIGATWYAGTNEDGLVVIKSIPVIPHIDPKEIPYWVIHKH